MFTTLIVQPIFNLLVLIYALIPGHNFGLAIILFTITIRLLMWPIIKKQLHHTKTIRRLQPELKRIQKSAKTKQERSLMMMELYKERGINPFAPLGPLLIQLPIFFGLYLGLQKIVKDPNQLIDFTYGPIANLPWMEQLASNIKQFDETLFSIVDLTKSAISPGDLYWPAMFIVVASVVVQYFQAKQLVPVDKDARGLRTILKEAGEGKQADQAELNAAIGKSTKFLLPAMIFIFTVSIASALSLYWLVSGAMAFIQQKIVLDQEEDNMIALSESKTQATKSVSDIPEAEVVKSPKKPKSKPKAKKSAKRKKRKK